LKLPHIAISTAMVFFHCLYAKHSFMVHNRFEVTVAAIVLAAKMEESPKKLNAVYGMSQIKDAQHASGTDITTKNIQY
jgi:hypothetical protein